MATIVEAPAEYDGPGPSLFLAGGISRCPNWQAEAVRRLDALPLALLNPRRAFFDMEDPAAAEEQITWEHRHLRRASALLFWFPHETLCPIALYELGAWSMTPKPLFVGTHPDYPRRQDVVVQTRLARPDVRVADRLDELVAHVRHWCAALPAKG